MRSLKQVDDERLRASQTLQYSIGIAAARLKTKGGKKEEKKETVKHITQMK